VRLPPRDLAALALLVAVRAVFFALPPAALAVFVTRLVVLRAARLPLLFAALRLRVAAPFFAAALR
jgi:hypothetical protein